MSIIPKNHALDLSLSSAVCAVSKVFPCDDGAQAHRARSDEGARTQSADGALGIITKSSGKIHDVLDQESGEIQRFTLDSVRREYHQKTDVSDARDARYKLQSSARSILSSEKTPRDTDWRVVDCLRKRVSSDVAVLLAPVLNKAHFANLKICGSVWTCPVCSAKISERRKAEIVAATDLHKAAGGGLYMVTLTWSHTRVDDLKTMIKASRDALTRLRKQRSYVSNLSSISYVGMIRALEVTYSDANGFHPHFHELFFTAKPLSRQQLRDWLNVLFLEWHAQCKRFGLGLPTRKFGVKITEAQSAAQYIAKFGFDQKWGIAAELTKSHQKIGKSASMTPWDFLRRFAAGEKRFAFLFRDYAASFFGSRQVFWSSGLKAKFRIDDLSDQQISERDDVDAVFVCSISALDWKKVLHQVYESRSLILRLAESGGADAIDLYLSSL